MSVNKHVSKGYLRWCQHTLRESNLVPLLRLASFPLGYSCDPHFHTALSIFTKQTQTYMYTDISSRDRSSDGADCEAMRPHQLQAAQRVASGWLPIAVLTARRLADCLTRVARSAQGRLHCLTRRQDESTRPRTASKSRNTVNSFTDVSANNWH
jgi:hypothetical protein